MTQRANQCCACRSEMFEGEGQMCKACLSACLSDTAAIVAMAIDSCKTKPGWISTAERLPEGDEHDEVLVCWKGRVIEIAEIGGVLRCPKLYGHWMPLPPLPATGPQVSEPLPDNDFVDANKTIGGDVQVKKEGEA